ncbi:Hsp70 family protein [Rhodococcus triatomae]
MATGLGLTVGSMQSTAALAADPAARGDGTVPDPQTHTVRTALALDGSGVSLLHEGDAAAVVVSGFANRVGDPVALIADDGSTHTGTDLVAATVRCLVDTAPATDAVAVAHPAVWTGHQADMLSDALGRAGLPDTVLVTEPQAAVGWMRYTHPSTDDAPIVVYDLGAGSLDVTVVQPAENPEILGTPLRSEEYSGSAFDHMVLQHVLGALPDGVDGIDPFEPATAAALTDLRARCRVAKEALSSDTATVVGVDLPGVRCDVRLVREELEDLIREPLADSVNVVHEAVRGAGLELSDIGSVLLVGGSSAVPLVAELLSSTLRLPVVADVDPASTAASGAALSAAKSAAAAWATTADADTAALAALGATIGASPAPAAPEATTASRTTTTGSDRGAGMTTAKKAALISAAAAAIAVLAAGGLSLGTGAFGPASGSTSGAATTTSPATPGASGTGSAAPTTAGAPGDAATAGGGSAVTGAANVPAGTRPGSSGTTNAVSVAGTTGAKPADPAAATNGSAPTQAATVAPAPAAPVYTPPAPAPAPAPSGGGTGVGQDVGDAAAGAGQGLGNVVGGVGDGLGGVVGGVGQGLGGVVGGVGGVVGGILGQ